jgi:hypothetical protein
MSTTTVQLTRHPGVDVKGFQERKLLQAELLGHDAQLRNFTPLRDRLVASGQMDAKLEPSDPFPTARSVFTYSFQVQVVACVTLLTGHVMLSSFIEVGETPNFVGQDQGQVTVQRSFFVPGGQAPAVAVALGVVSVQSPISEVRLDDPYQSFISTGDVGPSGPLGIVTFSYEPPILVESPR